MSAWIFQGNPQLWRATGLNKYLGANQKISWAVRPAYLGKDIREGDRVFMWRSLGDGIDASGVVAVGIIDAEPTAEPPTQPEVLPYEPSKDAEWPSAPTAKMNELWAIITLTGPVRLHPTDGMLSRDELKEHPVLSDLPIIKMPRPTTTKLGREHELALMKEWNSAITKT